MRELPYASEGQERSEAKSGLTVRVKQCVSQQYTVLVVLKNDFLLQYDTPHAVYRCRYFLYRELTDILVPVRTEYVSLILVKSKIELSPMLNNGTIKR